MKFRLSQTSLDVEHVLVSDEPPAGGAAQANDLAAQTIQAGALRSPVPERLDELHPEKIFRDCYRQKYCSADSILNEPSEQLMQAFRLLWEQQEKGEAG